MIVVRRPGARWELMLCLADFGDLTFQLRAWTNGGATAEYPWATFYESVNELEALLPMGVDDAIPRLLINGPEIGRLKRQAVILDALLDELGDLSFEEYLRHPRWLEVVRAARSALTAMVIAGPFETGQGKPGEVDGEGTARVVDAAGRWVVMGVVARLGDREYQEDVWVRCRAWQPTDPLGSFDLSVGALRANRVLPEPRDALPDILVDGPEVARLRELCQVLTPFLEKPDEAPYVARIGEPRWDDVIDRAWSALFEMTRKGPISLGPEPSLSTDAT